MDAFDEVDAGFAHGEGGGSEAVSFQNIPADDGEAGDAGGRRGLGVGIVDVCAPQIGAGGRHARAPRNQYLDDLFRLEGVADADAPVPATFVPAASLDVAAGIHEEIAQAAPGQGPRRLADRPTLDDAAGIKRAIRPPYVEIAVAVDPRLFRQGQDLVHLAAAFGRGYLAAIETRQLALGLERAEACIGLDKAVERRLEISLARRCVGDRYAYRHSHDQARLLGHRRGVLSFARGDGPAKARRNLSQIFPRSVAARRHEPVWIFTACAEERGRAR